MTLGEFRSLTKDVGDDVMIVLASDSEGNSYSPLAEVDSGIYEQETTYDGVVCPEDIYHGDNGKKAIVLWPTN